MDDIADVEHPGPDEAGGCSGIGAVLVPGIPNPRGMDVTVPFTARELAHLEVAAANAGVTVEQLIYDRAMAPTRR